MIQPEIARRVGVSRAQLSRWLRENGLQSNARDYPAEVVEAVLREYEQAPRGEGRQRVTERFADVRVRSVVERHKDYQPRQIRWTDEQIREAVKMAGLVSHTAQARYFNRPNAYEGAVKKLWMARMGVAPGELNGFGIYRAWMLATPGCPALLVLRMDTGVPIARVLWLDLVRHLRPGLEPWIVEAVQALAKFQAWIHGTTDTGVIRRMIAEREIQGGNEHTD
jgi:hypothetical protein